MVTMATVAIIATAVQTGVLFTVGVSGGTGAVIVGEGGAVIVGEGANII